MLTIISLQGFSYISGIDITTIYKWADTDSYIYNNSIEYIREIESKYTNEEGVVINNSYQWDISYKRNLFLVKSFNFAKTIKKDNEYSLESRMLDRYTNSMKVLPSLNRWHGWNLPHVTREQAPKKALTASELPDIPQIDTTNQGAIESKD